MKALFVVWLFVGVALLASLILTRPSAQDPTRGQPGMATRVAEGAKDAWLIIDGVEFFAAKQGAQVRVSADVNGTKFIYPSIGNVQWLEVGPSMSSQKFHLPPARERYIVRFEADVKVPAEGGQSEITGKLTSVNEDIIDVDDQIPFSNKYILHTFDPVHMARSANAEASISYRITSDP